MLDGREVICRPQVRGAGGVSGSIRFLSSSTCASGILLAASRETPKAWHGTIGWRRPADGWRRESASAAQALARFGRASGRSTEANSPRGVSGRGVAATGTFCLYLRSRTSALARDRVAR